MFVFVFMKYDSKYEKNQTRLVPNDDNWPTAWDKHETWSIFGIYYYVLLGSYVVVSILY